MTTEIANKQKFVLMRNGIEVWADLEKAERLETDLATGLKGCVRFEGRSLNTVDIIGVFLPEDIQNLTRRKNGEWQCEQSRWHKKFEECDCKNFRYDEKGNVVERFVVGSGWMR